MLFGADTFFVISSIFYLQKTHLFSPPQNVLLTKSIPLSPRFFTTKKNDVRATSLFWILFLANAFFGPFFGQKKPDLP